MGCSNSSLRLKKEIVGLQLEVKQTHEEKRSIRERTEQLERENKKLLELLALEHVNSAQSTAPHANAALASLAV